MNKPNWIRKGSRPEQIYLELCKGPKTTSELAVAVWGDDSIQSRQLVHDNIRKLRAKGYEIDAGDRYVSGQAGSLTATYQLISCPASRLTPLMDELVDLLKRSNKPLRSNEIEEAIWEGFCNRYSAYTLIRRTQKIGFDIQCVEGKGYFIPPSWRYDESA